MTCRVITTSEMTPVARLNGSAMMVLSKVKVDAIEVERVKVI